MPKRDLSHNFLTIYMSVSCCFADVKGNMDSWIGEWQRELEELSAIFKKLCSHIKSC